MNESTLLEEIASIIFGSDNVSNKRAKGYCGDYFMRFGIKQIKRDEKPMIYRGFIAYGNTIDEVIAHATKTTELWEKPPQIINQVWQKWDDSKKAYEVMESPRND